MKNKFISIFVMLMFLLSIPAVIAQNTTDAETTADTQDSADAETSSDAEVSADTEVQTELASDVITTSEVTSETEVEDNETEVEVEVEETPQTETEVEVEIEAEIEATDSGEVGNATQEETKIMTDVPGAKVRLLQLQEKLERNIAHGEEIISEVSSQGGDASSLETILDQLNALKDEIAAIDPTGVSVSEATAQFVAIKQKAIKLSKEFKTEARKLVKANRVAALKERLKVKTDANLARLKERVKDARDEHNAKVLSDILTRLGESNPELATQLGSGETTVKEAKAKVREEFKSLSKERKDQARLKLKERVSKEKIKRLEVRQELRTKGLANAKSRIEKRIEIRETEGLVKARTKITTKIESRDGENETETEVEVEDETEDDSDNSGSGSDSSGSGSSGSG